jgi:hypothetical protein
VTRAVEDGALGPDPPIDAVYTWVDGSDPAVAAELARHPAPPDPSAAGPCRFRDSGELRYSLRSLARHAPWIRRTHLVTNGQVPAWLALEHPDLHLVTHGQIFPAAAVLPTFNSTAIEAVLHRIPGLAPRFLYLNDDVFLGQPLRPDDLLTPDGGQVLHVVPWPLPSVLDEANVVDRQLAFNRLLLEDGIGRRRAWVMPAHGPQLYSTELVARVWERWRPSFELTLTHRFRATNDALVRVLYLNTLLHAEGGPGPHRVVVAESDVCRLVRLRSGDPASLRDLAALAVRPPAFFCLNDEVEDVEASGGLLERARTLLARCFPEPSPFESAPDVVPETA